MQKHSCRLALLACLLTSTACIAAPSLGRVEKVPRDVYLMTVDGIFHGRVQKGLGPPYLRYQWPGIYAEIIVTDQDAYFSVAKEPVILHVYVDGTEVAKLVKPAAGIYQLADLGRGSHVVRIESASENQAGPLKFGGFAVFHSERAVPPAPRKQQIEFIGDSHTVGYGNTSGKRECTEDEVWSTTDTSRAFGPLVAKHYDADYQVNAISGRGIVRNYGGFKADPLPVGYPFVLFDKAKAYQDAKWKPRVIVISLGTNDFSTPLNAGEPWKTRDELHADYEATYLKFLKSLRARNPQALIILWATDMANGEIQAEVKKVLDKFVSDGDKRTVFLPMNGLTFAACNWHPSTQDDETIAAALIKVIDERAAGLKPR